MSAPDQSDFVSKKLNRRSVVKGAAWTAPVEAVAVAVPQQVPPLFPSPSSRTVTAVGQTLRTALATIFESATTITCTVRGGWDGSSAKAGGYGALATGTIEPTGSDMTLELIAGCGVQNRSLH